MPKGQYNRNKETAPAPAPQPTGLTTFNVDVENTITAETIVTFRVVAQTKGEAINRAKQQLVFTAERSK